MDDKGALSHSCLCLIEAGPETASNPPQGLGAVFSDSLRFFSLATCVGGGFIDYPETGTRFRISMGLPVKGEQRSFYEFFASNPLDWPCC